MEPKAFTISQCFCDRCYTLFLNPCYSKDGFKILFSKASRSYGSSESHQLKQIEWIKSNNLLNSGDFVIDVGCYEGGFLSKLPGKIKKIGIDIDEGAIERGARLYADQDIDLICENFESFKIDIKPRLITMLHVLEHISNPYDTLVNLRKNSSVQTRLLIEVPVLEMGATNDINGFFSIQHQTHFSKSSLNRLLKLSGWEIVDTYNMNDYNGYGILAKISDVEYKIDHNNLVSEKLSLWVYLESYYKELASIQRKMELIPETEGFVIWGAGIHTELLFRSTTLFSSLFERKFIIVDSDPDKHGSSWRGINIYPPSVISKIDWSKNQVLISSYGSQQTIFLEAKKLGVPESAIRCLYDYINSY